MDILLYKIALRLHPPDEGPRRQCANGQQPQFADRLLVIQVSATVNVPNEEIPATARKFELVPDVNAAPSASEANESD